MQAVTSEKLASNAQTAVKSRPRLREEPVWLRLFAISEQAYSSRRAYLLTGIVIREGFTARKAKNVPPFASCASSIEKSA